MAVRFRDRLERLRTVGSEEDHGGAEEAQRRSGKVPAIGANTFGKPKPEHREGNVDATVSGIGTPCVGAIDAGQKVGKDDQRSATGYEPER